MVPSGSSPSGTTMAWIPSVGRSMATGALPMAACALPRDTPAARAIAAGAAARRSLAACRRGNRHDAIEVKDHHPAALPAVADQVPRLAIGEEYFWLHDWLLNRR